MQRGDILLQYRLAEQIGEGGMGIVWRAVDTTLDRDVAIKVLPDAFSNQPDRRIRFEREAKLLAALNHPNIAGIYGFHVAPATPSGEEIPFIAMELVEGETLADRLARPPALGVEEVLEICRQIAEGLEAAHECGVVHRDLKPANIKLRNDGTVKLLDFGLARAESLPASTSASPDAATAMAAHTQPGMVLGTAPYMSPEQARGIPVCKRADIWALGCILYECLAGRAPFEGATTTDVLAKIVSQPPDLAALGSHTPDFVKALLGRCLDKDPRRRLRDAGEMRVAIEEFQSDPASAVSTQPSPTAPRSRALLFVGWGLAALLGTAWFATSGTGPTEPIPSTSAVARWSIPLSERMRVSLAKPGGRFDFSKLVAISPDGSSIAYGVRGENAQVSLHLNQLHEGVPRPVAGTEGGRAPFFSPDGEWLGFLADAMVQKVALSGGSPQKICDVGRLISFDASWAPDGETIVFATDEGLWRVSAAGGTPRQLTRPDTEQGEVGHHTPHITADGKSVFFTVTKTPEMHVALLSLEKGRWEIVVEDASQGFLLEEKHLVFARSGELLVAPYDRTRHRLLGSAVSAQLGVHTTPGLGGMVLTQYAVSDSGTLVWVPATPAPIDQLVWVDRRGNESLITQGPGTWVHPRLSPDGRRVSVDIHSLDGMRDVYLYELERGQLNRLTHTGISWESEWRPDGDFIATLSGAPAGHWSLFWIRTDFSGPAELLYRASHSVPLSWLPDGRAFLFSKHRYDGGIWSLPVEGDREPQLVLRSAGIERFPSLSSDGKWMAYVAEPSGRREVFVQSYPELGPRHTISVGGGGEPMWSSDDRELFFREGDKMMVVDVSFKPGFRASRPRVLFSGEYDAALVGHQHYDVSNDGQRFLMIKHDEPVGPREVRVVLQWRKELSEILR